jgi:hypothetical protein
MKPISTRTHGILDYATAVVLYALPRIFRWDGRVTRFLTFMSAFLLGYSTFTRYELGIFKQLSMHRHLQFDMMSGLLMAASPTLLRTRDPVVNTVLTGLGLYEIAASRMTEPNEPPSVAKSSVPDDFDIPINVREFVRS